MECNFNKFLDFECQIWCFGTAEDFFWTLRKHKNHKIIYVCQSVSSQFLSELTQYIFFNFL